MDISILSEESIKIKGKIATFVVGPKHIKGKVEADAIISFELDSSEISGVENSRLTIQGAGEYEIGGVKISGLKNQNSCVYYLSVDKMNILLGQASALKGKEIMRDTDIALVFSDSVVDASVLASLNPKVVVFYGEKAGENSKTLGKEAIVTNKYSINREKLPAELEAILLQV